MKKLLLLAACCTLGMSQAQAQLIKQVLTISLTGYLGQTEKEGTSSITYKARAFKMTDKDICKLAAIDAGISVKSPQLVRIYTSYHELVGTYVMDGGRVVASADGYIDYGTGPQVETGTITANSRTGTATYSTTLYRYDSWRTPFEVSGMNTVTWKVSISADDIPTLTSYSYSATVSGGMGTQDDAPEDCGVFTGTIKATSSTAKTIPGLDW